MMENTENPLRCPVRLYEFYLSKWWVYSVTKLLTAACFNYKMGTCLLFVQELERSEQMLFTMLIFYNCLPSSSESVKQRTNLFFLQPERCCVPNSPLWFSSSPLDDSTKENMLIRILTVRELHVRRKKDGGIKQKKPDDLPYIPGEEEEGDSE